jgi:hypothetical protein
MKIQDLILLEMPMPADWDKSKFTDRGSFAKQLAYAMERAPKIGSGSSRVAFEIPYEGRKTVLKIAKNGKGLAQNEHEAQMLNDYYLKGLGIVIPVIDYDEQSHMPRWIHTEFANKAKDSDFMKACGLNLADAIRMSEFLSGKERPRNPQEQAWYNEHADRLEDNEFIHAFVDLIGNYDLPVGDFRRLANWGIYNGSPVVIDIGVNNEVWASHYAPKEKKPRYY